MWNIFQMNILQYLPFQEVHSNCLFVVFSENALAVTLDHTGLADSSIADHDHFDGHFHVLLQHGDDVWLIFSVPLCLYCFRAVTGAHVPAESVK